MVPLLRDPFTRIIAISVVLSLGFLSVVLAGALFKNWTPLISALFFSVAHLPVIICNKWSSGDFMSESSSNIDDFCKFLTAFLTVSGFALSAVLYHSNLIKSTALILNLIGGVLIHGTIFAFTSFFEAAEEAELTGFEI